MGLHGKYDSILRIRWLLDDFNVVHFNELLHVMMEETPITELERIFILDRLKSTKTIMNRFFGYMKLYRDIPAFQNLMNSDEFPVSLLEKYIYFLMRFEILNEGQPELVLQKYLPFLSQRKLMTLLSESKILSEDYEFYMQVFSKLENHSIDALLGDKADFRYFMTDMFLKFPEDIIKIIILHNQILYRYIMLFLELDNRVDEALDFAAKYFPVIEESEQVNEIVEIIHRINLNVTGIQKLDRGRRVSVFVSLILNTRDPGHILNLLEKRNAFPDPLERVMVRELVLNPEKRLEINFEVHMVDRKELLEWTRSEGRGRKFLVVE